MKKSTKRKRKPTIRQRLEKIEHILFIEEGVVDTFTYLKDKLFKPEPKKKRIRKAGKTR